MMAIPIPASEVVSTAQVPVYRAVVSIPPVVASTKKVLSPVRLAPEIIIQYGVPDVSSILL